MRLREQSNLLFFKKGNRRMKDGTRAGHLRGAWVGGPKRKPLWGEVLRQDTGRLKSQKQRERMDYILGVL